uniref:site-specific integrase n=1 Tax=Gemmiger formicilis TaxID=745368 RepID=UPI003FEEF691
MKDISKKALRRGHNEGNIRCRTDGRWEVRLSAGIDYKTGKPRRTSTCCNTRQEAIAILQQQAHEVRTQGWRDPMSVTLGEWYEYWLDTYMKDTVKQSTYASYRSYLNKHFCVLGKILLKKLEPHTLQEFYNYKFREEVLSPKTLRNYHMALHKCLQQAVKERLLVYNPCDAVTLPGGEKPETSVFTNDQQRALVQASYRHRYGVFIRLDLCTGLRMGELLALKWEDIDFSTAQLHVRRTINRLAKYEAHDGENKTEIVFGTPKTKNSRRTIPLTRTMADELARWKQQQAQDKQRVGDKYIDDGFIVTNEFGHYFEQKTFKDYYDR